MKVAALQFASTADPAENTATARALIEDAAGRGARIAVLPEEAMLGTASLDGELSRLAEASWPGYLAAMSAAARAARIAVVATGHSPGTDGRPRNTTVVIDDAGTIQVRYDKLHLYDAFDYRESDRVAPGEQAPVVLELAGLRLGLVTCYDLRFPEFSRTLVEQGAELLLVSAAWMSGRRKEDHWYTLLKARAIENTAWVVAAGNAAPGCIGGSCIVDPLGVVVDDLADLDAGVALAEIDRERTAEVRRLVPVLANRRMGFGAGLLAGAAR